MSEAYHFFLIHNNSSYFMAHIKVLVSNQKVLMFFLFLHRSICEYALEKAPDLDTSNVYTQLMFYEYTQHRLISGPYFSFFFFFFAPTFHYFFFSENALLSLLFSPTSLK